MNKIEFLRVLKLQPILSKSESEKVLIKKFEIKQCIVLVEKLEEENAVGSISRKRGRPPKSESSKLSEAELKQLSASEQRYHKMRFENNEASRRARLKRKAKDEALLSELEELERVNKVLTNRDRKLDKQMVILQEAIVNLIKNQAKKC